MVCKECEKCCNYMVCENGCYGSDNSCEYFVSDANNYDFQKERKKGIHNENCEKENTAEIL